jgi:hypothetical protein
MLIPERLLALRQVEKESASMKRHSEMLAHAEEEEKKDLHRAIEQSRATIAELAKALRINHHSLNKALVDGAIRGGILHCCYEHRTVQSILTLVKEVSREERLRILGKHRLPQSVHRWANHVISLDRSGKLREVVADARADYEWIVGERKEPLCFELSAECADCDWELISRLFRKIREDMTLTDTLAVLEKWDSGEMREAL